MPHMFANRPRLHDLRGGRADQRAHFRWETINAVTYKLGGVTFVVGSVLFLVASVSDLWHMGSEGARYTLFSFLGWQYLLGSIMFLAGGVFHYWRA